jgi:vacuolar-type H+-ATPase subunit E/Vma4
MENLSPLVKKIMAQAEAEASQIITEAEAYSRKLAQEGEAEAAKRSDAVLAKAEAEGRESVRRASVQASLSLRNAALAEKGKWVAEVLADLPSKLHSLNDKDYATMLRGFVLAAAPIGLVHVHPAEVDKGIFDCSFVKGINEALQARGQETTLILTGECADIDGGILLEGENVFVDCSLNSICEYHREELEPIILSQLFPVEESR